MKAAITTLFLLAACLRVQAEDVGHARQVEVDRSNQKEYGISITAESAGWPKGVLVFRIACPSKRQTEKFDHLWLDLVRARDEYYFRTSVATSTKSGVETGSFQIHQSTLKDCIFGVMYRDEKGVNVIYRVDLKSYLEKKK